MQQTVNEAPVIKKTHTACIGCYFATVKGTTQTGCSIGLIDQFKRVAEVVEAKDGLNESVEFYIINGRNCNYKRTRAWGNRFGTNHDIAYVQARKELFPLIELFIYVDSIDADSLKKLDTTLESMDVKQMAGIRIINRSYQDPEPLSRHFQQQLFKLDINHMKWTICNIMADADYERSCDIAIKQAKNPYFMVCKAGFKFPKKMITRLDFAINDNLVPVSMVYFDDDTYITSNALYKLVGGNNGNKLFVNKIKDAAKLQKTEDYILYG
jgi:hypothetical protein